MNKWKKNLLNYPHKRIYVKAGIENNLGDDLFIYILCKRYNKVIFYLEGEKKYKDVFNKLSNLRYISNDTRFYRIFETILRLFNENLSLSKLFMVICYSKLLIGGSMFQYDVSGIFQDCKDFYKDSYILGCNFGPFTNKRYYEKFQNYFNTAADVCFRDTYSYKLFTDINNVRYAPDIVLSMDYNYYYQTKNYYVLSVIDFKIRKYIKQYGDSYLKKIIEIIKKLNNKGSNIVIMSFCEREGDMDMAKKIYNLVGGKHIYIYNHKNIECSLKILSQSKGIISTRFHSMVLSWVLNKPSFHIVYGEKMLHVLEDFDIKNGYVLLEDINNLDIDNVINNLQKPSYDVSLMKNLAEKQFEKLDELLLNYR